MCALPMSMRKDPAPVRLPYSLNRLPTTRGLMCSSTIFRNGSLFSILSFEIIHWNLDLELTDITSDPRWRCKLTEDKGKCCLVLNFQGTQQSWEKLYLYSLQSNKRHKLYWNAKWKKKLSVIFYRGNYLADPHYCGMIQSAGKASYHCHGWQSPSRRIPGEK